MFIYHLRMPQLSAEDKTKILYDTSMKMSFRSIDDKYNISHTTVSRVYKKFVIPVKVELHSNETLNLNIHHKRHSLKFNFNVFFIKWCVFMIMTIFITL